ncbi:unnamed protein product, partial [Caretta caretta]
TSLKTSLLRANSCKLSTVLAELEQKRKPTHPWSDCISNWKERDCAHSSVLISCCVKMKRFEHTSSRGAASGPGNNSKFLPGDSNPANGICKTLYDYQAKSDDELSLQKGVWLIAAPTGRVSRLQANGATGSGPRDVLAALPASPIGLEQRTAASGSRDQLNLRMQQ